MAETKPNVVWIMADDLSYGDLGCYGQKLIQTPNLDRLAQEGMRFTQCYSGSTVCAPSRSCLMQGLHPGHATVDSRVHHVASMLSLPPGGWVVELLYFLRSARGLGVIPFGLQTEVHTIEIPDKVDRFPF